MLSGSRKEATNGSPRHSIGHIQVAVCHRASMFMRLRHVGGHMVIKCRRGAREVMWKRLCADEVLRQRTSPCWPTGQCCKRLGNFLDVRLCSILNFCLCWAAYFKIHWLRRPETSDQARQCPIGGICSLSSDTDSAPPSVRVVRP